MKNNSAVWLRMMIYIGSLLVAISVAWATLGGSVRVNEGDIAENKKQITIVDAENKARMTVVEKDLSAIRGDVREMRVEQKYILQGLKKIEDKLK